MYVNNAYRHSLKVTRNKHWGPFDALPDSLGQTTHTLPSRQVICNNASRSVGCISNVASVTRVLRSTQALYNAARNVLHLETECSYRPHVHKPEGDARRAKWRGREGCCLLTLNTLHFLAAAAIFPTTHAPLRLFSMKLWINF